MATGMLPASGARPPLDLTPVGRGAARAAVGLTIGSAAGLVIRHG